jgi:hypothetical protein
MKNLFLFMCLFLILSCKKEPVEPVVQQQDMVDSLDNEYEYGGVYQNGTGADVLTLSGTEWVLEKVVFKPATTYEYPKDTVRFISDSEYTINSDTLKRKYVLSPVMGSTNYSLSLYFFEPFGGSLYGGQIGAYSIQSGQLSNVEFDDLQDDSKYVTAWFVKL